MMNISGINEYSHPNFTAKLCASDKVMELTYYEVLEGRHDAYREALKALSKTHKGDLIDIVQNTDGKSINLINRTKKEETAAEYNGNLAEVIFELARPTSKLHKEVFKCDGSNEVYDIKKEFYDIFA